MTNKEFNATIKKELKEAGFNTKDFSVSVKDCGYSTSINVKVKSPKVNRKEVEGILSHFSNYETDTRTGEILSGGNTFLFVDYDHGIFDEVAKEYELIAKEAMSRETKITKIFDGLYLINMDGITEVRQRNDKDSVARRCCFESLCEYIYKFLNFGTIAA